MQLEKLIQTLMNNNDFFDMFRKEEIEELLKCCSPAVFNDSDIIFSENSPGQEFYTIIKGSVLVSRKGRKIDIARDGTANATAKWAQYRANQGLQRLKQSARL